MSEPDRSEPLLRGPEGPERSGRRYRWAMLKGVAAYTGFAALWILLSDRAMRWLFRDPAALHRAEVEKGLAFVLATTAMLYLILDRQARRLAARDAEARRQGASLRESKQRLELAVASARLGVWDRNLVDGTEVWNEEMFATYGLVPDRPPLDYEQWLNGVVHPEDRAGAAEAIRAALAGERAYRFLFRAVRPDGQVRHIMSYALVLRDAEGNPQRLIGVNRDRTDEVAAEAERRRLLVELQHAEKLESMGILAGGVAHDMNNVLAAILGMASAMRADCPPADPRTRPLDTIIRACSRGRDVVRSLLYFARKDLGTVGPLDLNAVVREVLQLLSYTTLQRIRISTELQTPLPAIQGDAGALSHALINLCVNAVDAMPEGGALTVSTALTPAGRILVSVTDTGHGMDPEVARRAVEPFFTTKPVGKGTGMGLATVYGTVQAHQGTLAIHSEPGRGTRVELDFPPLDEPVPAAGEAVPPPAPGTGGSLRILLVDDDELIRLSVGPMLEALGHRVATAESGPQALELLQAGPKADLVILDMNMPGMNGAQTLARILAWRPEQRVLLATGYSDDAIAPLLEGRPNVASIRKPFTAREITAKLG